MNAQTIENLASTGKLMSSEHGRTSHGRVGYRELYRLADKRYLTVCRDGAQSGRIVEWKITKTRPAKWNVSAW